MSKTPFCEHHGKLEALITRQTIEEILEGKYPKETKKRAKEGLKILKLLERSVVQLYLALGLTRKAPSHEKAYEKYVTEIYPIRDD